MIPAMFNDGMLLVRASERNCACACQRLFPALSDSDHSPGSTVTSVGVKRHSASRRASSVLCLLCLPKGVRFTAIGCILVAAEWPWYARGKLPVKQ